MHRVYSTKGYFSKVVKCNQLIHLEIKKSKLDKMGQQRNSMQIKKQVKTPEEELSEMEIGNLPAKDLKVMIVKMFKDLRRMEKQSEKLLMKSKKI